MTTRSRESFEGANPVRFLRETHPIEPAVPGATDRRYQDFVDGKVIEYGSRNGGEDAAPRYGRKVYAPPRVTPVDREPGHTVDLKFTVTTYEGENDELKTVEDVTWSETYIGREVVETPLGTINACKFIGTSITKYATGEEVTSKDERWIAADGPYRGRDLKYASTRNGEPSAQQIFTKITYSPK